jgi:hypothetical protein
MTKGKDLAAKGWLSISNKYRHVATLPDADIFELAKQYDPMWYESIVHSITRHLHRCAACHIVEVLTEEEFAEFKSNGGKVA